MRGWHAGVKIRSGRAGVDGRDPSCSRAQKLNRRGLVLDGTGEPVTAKAIRTSALPDSMNKREDFLAGSDAVNVRCRARA